MASYIASGIWHLATGVLGYYLGSDRSQSNSIVVYNPNDRDMENTVRKLASFVSKQAELFEAQRQEVRELTAILLNQAERFDILRQDQMRIYNALIGIIGIFLVMIIVMFGWMVYTARQERQNQWLAPWQYRRVGKKKNSLEREQEQWELKQ